MKHLHVIGIETEIEYHSTLLMKHVYIEEMCPEQSDYVVYDNIFVVVILICKKWDNKDYKNK